MKTLEEIYEEIEKYNIPIVEVRFSAKKAGIITNGEDTVIAVDYSKIKNKKEEKMIMAEEKAHYETNSFYSFDADKDVIIMMEYIALRRVYNELIPFDELKELRAQNLSESELSDYFGVPIAEVLKAEFLYDTIAGYKEN